MKNDHGFVIVYQKKHSKEDDYEISKKGSYVEIIDFNNLPNGLLGITVQSANKVLMLQNAIYSVISPEGCASILWRDNSKAELAADSLGITAKILKENNIIEEIINEPIGGAHRDHSLSIKNVEESIKKALNEIKAYSKDKLLLDRKEKFIQYGRFFK